MVTIRDFASIYDDSIIVKWYPHEDNPHAEEYFDEDEGCYCKALYYTSMKAMIRDLDEGGQPFKAGDRIDEVYFDDGWFVMRIFESDNIESWTYHDWDMHETESPYGI